jgi:hypothetical protein
MKQCYTEITENRGAVKVKMDKVTYNFPIREDRTEKIIRYIFKDGSYTDVYYTLQKDEILKRRLN